MCRRSNKYIDVENRTSCDLLVYKLQTLNLANLELLKNKKEIRECFQVLVR